MAAGVKAITIEEGQIVIRADSLEKVDRDWLQRRMGDRARVMRRAVWVPLDEGSAQADGENGRWRVTLAAVLQAIVEGLDEEV